MSSLASLFNSTATLFTVDFYERLRPQSSEAHLVNVGRLATVVVVLAGIAWIPIMQLIGGGQLYGYLQNVQSLLAPAIAAVFMLGIFSKHVSPISGFVGIVSGFVIGMTRLLMQVGHEMAGLEFGALQWFVDINWLYFCFLLFVFTCVVIFVVSSFTPKATDAQLTGLTYATITNEQKAEVHAGESTWDFVHSGIVLAIVAAIYLYFW
jgi:SSS family solute:Na+ symporter